MKRLLVVLLLASCSRSTGTPAPSPVPSWDVVSVVDASSASDAVAAGDATHASLSRPFTGITLRIVERHADTTAPYALHSTVVIDVADERGPVTTATVQLPCWAHPETGELVCTFGASYERARVEVQGGKCTVVTDFFGENTGEKRNARRLAVVPCHEVVDLWVTEAPGLADFPR